MYTLCIYHLFSLCMKQKITYAGLLLWCLLLLYFFLANNFWKDTETQGVVDIQQETKTGSTLTTKEINEQIVAEKIAKLKARYAQKWLIIAGDTFLKEAQFNEALDSYKQALKASPADETLIKKLWDSYFQLKNYTQAYNAYAKIVDHSWVDLHKLWLSFIYSRSYSIENKKIFEELISWLPLSAQDSFYYTTVLECLEDFHICKKQFQESFALSEQEITSPRLISLQNAIIQYENFKVDQIYYKDTLIIQSFFEQQQYPFVILLGQDILQDRPTYRPVLKMLAQSWMELGDYAQAKKYLDQLNVLDPNTPEVLYILWIIHQKRDDYILSNIFFKKSIEYGYSQSVYPYRLMIQNFLDLWNNDKLLAWFRDLYAQENSWLTDQDVILGVYYHILYDDFNNAEKIIVRYKDVFVDSADIYGLAAWIQKEKWHLDTAQEYLDKAYQLDRNNAMVTLNMAQVLIAQDLNSKAIFYLKQTLKNDPNGEFGSIAQSLLDEKN